MMISSPDDDSKASLNEFYSQAVLDECKMVKKAEAAGGSHWFRLEFPINSAIAACEMNVNSDGSYSTIIIYYGESVKDNVDDPQAIAKKPRAEIKYTGYKKNQEFSYENEFSEAQFFKAVGKDKLVALGHYKDYTITDQRIKTTKNEKRK